jgi:hypothetical protein
MQERKGNGGPTIGSVVAVSVLLRSISMTRGTFLTGAVAAALALSVTPALAQRSSGGAESTGSAVSRGGGGDGGGAVSRGSSGGDSGASSSGSASGGSSGSASSAPSSSPRSNDYIQAPTRPSERQGRSRTDAAARSGGGERAVSRGAAGELGSSTAPSRTGSATAGSDLSSDPSRRAVPSYSRPRDGRPVTGEAVDRTFPPSPGGGSGYYRPIYPYYGQYYWPGLYGTGFYYDPLWYDPFYYGAGFGLGYGGYGGGGYYGGNPYGSSGSGSYSHAGTGSLRLKIKPRNAEVYIDGYFVGTVDQFDGTFQKLKVDAGTHRIEIRAEGRESSHIDVVVAPGETITYEGQLKAIQ